MSRLLRTIIGLLVGCELIAPNPLWIEAFQFYVWVAMEPELNKIWRQFRILVSGGY